MFLGSIDTTKFLQGFKYGLLAEIALIVLLGLIWLIITGSLVGLPILLLTFGIGGIYLTIGGCIGPGRYQRHYDILLYSPESGSSYSDEFVVSGFVIDDSITEADIYINNRKVDTLEFDPETNSGEITLSRRDFINSALNTIYLQAGEKKSNNNEFALFEYTEDMTEEEVDEFHRMETQKPEKTLLEAKQNYINKISSRTGSISLGLAVLGIINLSLSLLVDLLQPLIAG